MEPTAHDQVMEVVRYVHAHPCSVKSDPARTYALAFAAAACAGYITTKDGADSYGGTWKVTMSGLGALESHDRPAAP